MWDRLQATFQTGFYATIDSHLSFSCQPNKSLEFLLLLIPEPLLQMLWSARMPRISKMYFWNILINIDNFFIVMVNSASTNFIKFSKTHSRTPGKLTYRGGTGPPKKSLNPQIRKYLIRLFHLRKKSVNWTSSCKAAEVGIQVRQRSLHSFCNLLVNLRVGPKFS